AQRARGVAGRAVSDQVHGRVVAVEARALHYIRIGDGPYSVTGGWPSVYAMHNGGGFCGLPPTGKPVFMRVMDFYLHHEASSARIGCRSTCCTCCCRWALMRSGE